MPLDNVTRQSHNPRTMQTTPRARLAMLLADTARATCRYHGAIIGYTVRALQFDGAAPNDLRGISDARLDDGTLNAALGFRIPDTLASEIAAYLDSDGRF